MLIADKDEADVLCVKKLLKARFKVKDVSEVQIVFGIRVERYSQKMTLDQSKYVRVIFKQFLDSASPQYFILMEPNVVHMIPDKEEEVLNEERRSRYLQAIEKLMHLCQTRLDIIFSVHKLAGFVLIKTLHHSPIGFT